jgi:hypothetical protein
VWEGIRRERAQPVDQAPPLMPPVLWDVLVDGPPLGVLSGGETAKRRVRPVGVRLGALGLRDQLEGDAELGLVHVTMLTLDEEADPQFAKEVGAVHVAGDALGTL